MDCTNKKGARIEIQPRLIQYPMKNRYYDVIIYGIVANELLNSFINFIDKTFADEIDPTMA